jgi:hypothetical protein
VSSELRVDDRDAELLLQKYGLAPIAGEDGVARNSSARVLADVLADPLGRLAQEVRRTLGYWQGVTRGQKPEQIYLFGGGGAVSGVSERLSRLLDLGVVPWELPVEQSSDDQDLPPVCLLGAAVGLSALAWEVV